MKVVIPGGAGHLGRLLSRALRSRGFEVVVLSRSPGRDEVAWDGRTLGEWARELDGADVVVNLAGRSVNCRYTKANLAEMMSSRVDSTRVVGEAIARAARPPRLWIQMSTATIYAHRFDAANDEATGHLGGSEPGAPAYWGFSVEIAKAWEQAQAEARTPGTRKVALRAAMVMSAEPGGVFSVLSRLARFGLGGRAGSGEQFVSWIHEDDFLRAVLFLIEHEEIEGPVNLASPEPLPQRDLMRDLRAAWRMPFGLPAPAWLLEIGAFFLRTDTELLLKSRRVVPGRLLASGFRFERPSWSAAAGELVARS